MEPVLKWHERDALPRHTLDRLMQEGGFREISEIAPYMKDHSKFIKIGDKIAVLMNNGITAYYTITSMRDASGYHVVGRDETGVQKKGMELALDSSMSDIYDRGYKKLDKFPWE